MRALKGRFGIDGTVKPLGPVPSLTGQLSFSHPSVIRLLRAFDIKYRPADRNLGGVKLKSNIIASSAAITLSRMTGEATGVSFRGDLALKLNGPKPAVTANLTTGALDLNKYVSRPKKRPRRANYSGVTPLKLSRPMRASIKPPGRDCRVHRCPKCFLKM